MVAIMLAIVVNYIITIDVMIWNQFFKFIYFFNSFMTEADII